VSALSQYQEKLKAMPHSGGGGLHTALLSMSNLGALAGLARAQVFADLRAHVQGSRRVPDVEIRQAVDKAFDERGQPGHGAGHAPQWQGVVRPPIIDARKMLTAILQRGAKAEENDLVARSPVKPGEHIDRHSDQLLMELYEQDDLLFMGERYDIGGPLTLQPVSAWLKDSLAGAYTPQHICPNPLTGATAPTKTGKLSKRCDASIKDLRFCVVEFDSKPTVLREPTEADGPWARAEQIQFWAGALLFGWPVAALIDSGGKSIHAWLQVKAQDLVDWKRQVRDGMFGRFLVPMGADSACCNPSRLSRTPGHQRRETGRWQRLLYLNPQPEIKP
jgi:hypothetical protein